VPDQQALDRYVRDRMPAWIEELREFCAIPSEEQETAALGEAAEWTSARLARLGASVETMSIDGVAPLVVGSIGTGRTLLAVQHYDVQPAVPLELWTTGPYDPHVRDGRLYARGATDNKGEFLSRVWGVEAYLATFGSLPCRIRFLVEGEEEHGSPNLDRLLDLGTDLRLADGALAEGGGVDSEGRPVIVGGGRGMLLIELVARTIAYDAHSSGAMLLPNAAVRLVQALSTLWRADGLPALDVTAGTAPPTAAQLGLLESAPMDWQDRYRDEFGIDAFLAGRTGMEAAIASTFETTVNLQSIWSGFTGPGSKTIVPAEAHARIDIRLVPDQDPDAILRAVRERLDGAGFADIAVECVVPPARAWWTPSDHPILAAAKRASSAVFGVPAEQEVAMSGTIPMYQVCARHNVPLTSLGAGHDDCRAHAPDENYRLDYAEQAARTMARFIDEFAAMGDA
jgi:acetylornithine deacetylase/succinyl-diaminopimelate desuccinylase-like protein